MDIPSQLRLTGQGQRSERKAEHQRPNVRGVTLAFSLRKKKMAWKVEGEGRLISQSRYCLSAITIRWQRLRRTLPNSWRQFLFCSSCFDRCCWPDAVLGLHWASPPTHWERLRRANRCTSSPDTTAAEEMPPGV